MKTDAEQRYNELKSTLRLDLLRMDEALIELPVQVMEAGEWCSYAIFARDEIEHDLKIEMSKAADLMRRQNDKISEAKITSQIPLDEDVALVRFKLEEAKKDVMLWQALVNALTTKTSSLKRVSDLMVSGYLTPSATREGRRSEISQARRRLTEGD